VRQSVNTQNTSTHDANQEQNFQSATSQDRMHPFPSHSVI